MIKKYIKKQLGSAWKTICHDMAIYWEYIIEEPKYLFPIRIILVVFGTLNELGSYRMEKLSTKFKDWSEFDAHMRRIMLRLNNNGKEEWADAIECALYVSQSFYEIRGELLLVLRPLVKQKFTKTLMIKKDVKKVISYLNSVL